MAGYLEIETIFNWGEKESRVLKNLQHPVIQALILSDYLTIDQAVHLSPENRKKLDDPAVIDSLKNGELKIEEIFVGIKNPQHSREAESKQTNKAPITDSLIAKLNVFEEQRAKQPPLPSLEKVAKHELPKQEDQQEDPTVKSHS